MAVYGKQHRGLVLLLLGAVVALAGATVVDYPLTKWCGQHNWPAFSDFMSRSLFEGEPPGGGDPVILFLVGMVCAYALSRRPSAPERIAAWRPALGFMVLGGILTAFVYVHMLKWLVARARPYLVFNGQQAFSAWYEIGPHFVTEGIYRGSFPSGHTAQAFAMMVLAYALAGSPSASRGQKTAGWLVGAGVAVYTLAMGLARCMSGAHWVTDVAGSMAISWVILHLLYFNLLKVPQQQGHREALYRSGRQNDSWEIFLGFYLTAAALGILLAGIGLRALWIDNARWLAALLVPGIPLIAWGIRRSTRCCGSLYRSLEATATEPLSG